MIITQIDNVNYLVKIPFNKENQYFFDSNDEILSFFKNVFSKLITKYKICGDVIIDFYLDYDYGIILQIFCKNSVSKNSKPGLTLTAIISNFFG